MGDSPPQSLIFNPQSLHNILLNLTPQRKFLVAYSGGVDSHVLLHSIANLRTLHPEIEVQAVHVNHNLSPNADKWVEHCRNICSELEIEYHVKNVFIDRNLKQSLEAVARHVRYQAFAELLKPDVCLLTGHTQNDQAETVLLQLFRGAGPNGLSAMPAKMNFATGVLIRPLLNFTRADLLQYANSHHLHWIEDESNFNLDFDRNFIRSEVLPIVQKRWPNIFTTVSRSAKHCAEASELLSELAAQDLHQVRGTIDDTLSISALTSLSEARQRNVLRAWLRQLKFPIPSEVKLRQIQFEIICSSEDAIPIVSWEETEIRRYQDDLYVMKPVSFPDSNWSAEWNLQQPLKLPQNLGFLVAKPSQAKGLLIAPQSNVIVRFRHEGERCHPVGRIGSHPLKKLFQEWNVPPWQRNQVPLMFVEDKLMTVVNYCLCEGFVTQGNERGIIISLEKTI